MITTAVCSCRMTWNALTVMLTYNFDQHWTSFIMLLDSGFLQWNDHVARSSLMNMNETSNFLYQIFSCMKKYYLY